jgi:tetratricopeptide (TPR) repeat protein
MDTYYTIEEKYLQAVDEINYGENPKGLKLLNEIISNDPLHARAHYQLGKIFYYEIKDYQAAGYHFKTCAELEPSFPDVYYHYLHLIVFLNMDKKVNEVAVKALTIPGVSAAAIHNLLGLFAEKNKSWTVAINEYQSAFIEVIDKKHQEDIEISIERVKQKMQHNNNYRYYLAD